MSFALARASATFAASSAGLLVAASLAASNLRSRDVDVTNLASVGTHR
jgi:hypothetical protein